MEVKKIRIASLKKITEEQLKAKIIEKLGTNQFMIPYQLAYGSYQGHYQTKMGEQKELELKIVSYKAIIFWLFGALLLSSLIFTWFAVSSKQNEIFEPKKKEVKMAPIAKKGALLPDASKDVQKMTASELKTTLQMKADQDYFKLQVGTNGEFVAGNPVGRLEVINPQENTNPISVAVHLKDNDELIYESGGIQPNHYLSEVHLKRALEAGTYPAIAQVSIYDERTQREITQSVVQIELNVQPG